ncbi:MAG: tRNA preQ1(34) S-adenosylmethionine ribosyltransferase-isomerase QueA [Planctomycetes bacterium]|nr:tRNA preQ1(34) S-adenosylmethionine ribosyltransferase-isomerase QueA [Planctomycetota bacterium]
MLLSEFHFDLPPELIAQHPIEPRDHCRLMVLDRASGERHHLRFDAILDWLRPGDVLVLNDTRVIPARLIGRRKTGGVVRVLLVRELDRGVWETLLTSAQPLRVGERISFCPLPSPPALSPVPPPAEGDRRVPGPAHFPDGAAEGEAAMGGLGPRLVATVRDGARGRPWLLAFDPPDVLAAAEAIGRAPLPPYIRRDPRNDPAVERDRAAYQTVYAARPGAIAAPTAGLHFTPPLLDRIRRADVQTVPLTLHVGVGTFLPVGVERVEEHRLAPEAFECPAGTRAAVRQAKAERRRVIAVGTTVTRVLEDLARRPDLAPEAGESALYIHPPFEFRVVDALLTNFHLPDGTPLLLAAAFAGRERLLDAYREAVSRGYRFFSYGDAMFVV